MQASQPVVLNDVFSLAVREPAESYHAKAEYIGRSDLIHVLKTPQHFLENWLTHREPTPEMAFGSQFHTLLLEGREAFDQRYLIAEVERWDGRTTVCKDIAAQADDEGKEVVLRRDFERMRNMLEGVRNHAGAQEILAAGEPELSFYTEIGGIKLKCRTDWLQPDGTIVDLKTVRDASYEAFSRSIINDGYAFQAAAYCAILSQVAGRPLEKFKFIAVEKSAPYLCATYELDFGSLELGRVKFERALRILAQCRSTNVWPGYPETTQMISVPQWAFSQEEMI